MQCDLAIMALTMGLPGYGSAIVGLARERGVDPETRADRALYTLVYGMRFHDSATQREIRDAAGNLYRGREFEYSRSKMALINSTGQGDGMLRELRRMQLGGGLASFEILERTPGGENRAGLYQAAKLELINVLRTLSERQQIQIAPRVEELCQVADAIKNTTVRATRARQALELDETAPLAVEDPLMDSLLAACWYAERKRPMPSSRGGADVLENEYDPLAPENM